MADDIPFRSDMPFAYGVAQPVAPGIRRIVANNPSHFTLYGTNTYIIGAGEVAVLDPGPALDDHVKSILATLRAGGERLSHIVCTHTHSDHSPAAAPLKAETGAKTYGYGQHGGGKRVDSGLGESADYAFIPDVRVKDGDRIEGKGWTLGALHTPGHTSNHICFAYEEENACFTGDHVMGWNTSVISPPDGNMTDYMQSLRKLREAAFSQLWPAHGPPVNNPRPFISAYIAHRMMREREIAACLSKGVTTIPEMVQLIYADKPPALHKAAARSVLSHLEHMVDTGRVIAEQGITPDGAFRLP